MKKIFLSLLAAILYICSVGSVFGQTGSVTGIIWNTKVIPNLDGLGGTVYLCADGVDKYHVETTIDAKKQTTFTFTEVAAGTYKLRAELSANNGSVYVLKPETDGSSVDIVVEEGATVSIPVKDARTQIAAVGKKSTLTFTGFDIKEDGTREELGNIDNATITCKSDGIDPVIKTTDASGVVQFDLVNAKTYSFSFSAEDYIDTTFSLDQMSSAYRETYEISVRKKQIVVVPTATVNGTVTINGKAIADDNPLPAGLSLRITPAEGEPMTMNLADGQFEFEEVPEGAATFQLYEGQNVAYEFRVSDATKAMTVTAGEAANIHTIDIERFASKVVCTFTAEGTPELLTGEVYLKKDGVTQYTLDLTKAGLTFLEKDKEKAFRGVLPGTYTLDVFCRQGYGPQSLPAEVVVTLEADVTVPEIILEPATTALRFVCNELQFYNKYLDSTVYLKYAFAELWNEEGSQFLDTVTCDSRGYFRLTHKGGIIGNKYRIKLTHPDIRPTEIEVTTKTIQTDIVFENVVFKPIPTHVLDFAGVWDPTTKSVALTWSWPEKMTDLEIAEITLDRRAGTAEPVIVNTWTKPSMTELPTAFNDDKAENGRAYTYACSIRYTNTLDTTLVTMFDIDLRIKYMLEYKTNDAGMGEITSNFVPGEYLAGTEIKLTAKPKDGHTFMYWVSGKDTVSEATEFSFKLTQDTNLTAIFEIIKEEVQYTLTLLSNNTTWGLVKGGGTFDAGTEVTAAAIPVDGYEFIAWTNGNDTVSTSPNYKFFLNKDMTLTAHFASKTANEDLEANRWSIFAENGVVVIRGLDGDRYTVYDLNGRMAGQAQCNGTEIRLTVAPNQLYVVRRISAQGAFGFKKIVVR